MANRHISTYDEWLKGNICTLHVDVCLDAGESPWVPNWMDGEKNMVKSPATNMDDWGAHGLETSETSIIWGC